MKVILDLDTGIDDALALALALGRPDCELVGVTCVYGNIDVDGAVRNTLGLLALLGHEEVPVHRGCAGPTSGAAYERKRESVVFHGANGIGGAKLPVSDASVARTHAAEFLVESARRWGSDLVIVPTGPLTNIARAIELDEGAMSAIGGIVLMGGALAVPGNVSPFAEANISYDPEAANVVFTRGARVTMVGLDVTLRTTLSQSDVDSWRKLGERGVAYAEILGHYLHATKMVSPGAKGCALHDPLALAVALDPTYVLSVPLCVFVRTDEGQRGRTVLDQRALEESSKREVRVALDVDSARFTKDFMGALNVALTA
ncbi:MAG: nucleoside hydrolase [Coriobacteriaceae bacterium]|nr:nucleoside hydrolase [Coriobacteriaceae bacterium]